MKNSYTIFWEEQDANGNKNPGWYCQVSGLIFWGPFESQAEALESMMMEWPRYENVLNPGCDSLCGGCCSPEGCNSCQTDGCNV